MWPFLPEAGNMNWGNRLSLTQPNSHDFLYLVPLPPQRSEGGMWIVDRPTRLLSLRIKRNETVFKRVPPRARQRNRRRAVCLSLSERRNGDGGTTVSVVFAIWSPHSDGGREGRKAKAKSSNNHSAAAEAMCPFLGSTAAAHLGHLGHVNMHIRWGSERRRLPGAVRVAGAVGWSQWHVEDFKAETGSGGLGK